MARILVVEGNGLSTERLAPALAALGHELCAAALTGFEASALAARHGPDLAIVDLRLRTGGDAAAVAQTLLLRHGLPTVFVTRPNDGASLRRAARAGPSGIVLFPFDLRQLRAEIDLALHRRALTLLAARAATGAAGTSDATSALPDPTAAAVDAGERGPFVVADAAELGRTVLRLLAAAGESGRTEPVRVMARRGGRSAVVEIVLSPRAA